jgi:hypothetical protein
MTDIADLYRDPKFGLVGVRRFKEKLKEKKGIEINTRELQQKLGELEEYTLNRPVKKNKIHRHIIAHDIDEQWQADLVEMDVPQGAKASENDGVRYLLTVIDVLTRYAWVRPLKNKTGASIASAFKSIFDEGSVPHKVQTDMGTEFYNTNVAKLFNEYEISLFSSQSDHKAAIVERFNRTLKMRMSKLFDVTQTFRYIDNLQDLVFNYNNTYHSSIKMTPSEATENPGRAYYNLTEGHEHTLKNNLKVGDLVRIPMHKTIFSKEWIGKWTIEIFKIKRVLHTEPPAYKIEDLKDEEVKGAFYENELQKVPKSVMNKPFRIEKILNRRISKKKPEVLVKYLGWPDKFNEWIEANKVQNHF